MMQSISVLHMNYLPFFQQAANKIFVKNRGAGNYSKNIGKVHIPGLPMI
jgi:hypothetical protein